MGNALRTKAIRLDPIGGAAGDMFCAAMLDAFPQLQGTVSKLSSALPLPPDIKLTSGRFHDGVIDGRQFRVEATEDHAHRSWRDIQEILNEADVPAGAKAMRLQFLNGWQ